MHDMTKKERQLNKEKWEEAKTKNDEAKSNEELESGGGLQVHRKRTTLGKENGQGVCKKK